MRYAKDHKVRTRERILASAGRLLRTQGYAATGVADAMAVSDLTVGAFYAHFASKEELFSAVLEQSLALTRSTLLAGLDEVRGAPFVRELARRYLSRAHRDAPADGCALPALAAEVARASEATRAEFDRHLEGLLDEIAPHVATPGAGGLSARDRTLALAALLIGGITLARAVKSRELSDRILQACKRFAVVEAEA